MLNDRQQRLGDRSFYLAATACYLALVTSACAPSSTGTAQLDGNAASAEANPKVAITVTDAGCQPTQLTTQAGKTTFVITNKSSQILEWEILKQGMVVEEKENIPPGFVQELKAKLDTGQYDMTCGLRSNPKGAIAVNPK